LIRKITNLFWEKKEKIKNPPFFAFSGLNQSLSGEKHSSTPNRVKPAPEAPPQKKKYLFASLFS